MYEILILFCVNGELLPMTCSSRLRDRGDTFSTHQLYTLLLQTTRDYLFKPLQLPFDCLQIPQLRAFYIPDSQLVGQKIYDFLIQSKCFNEEDEQENDQDSVGDDVPPQFLPNAMPTSADSLGAMLPTRRSSTVGARKPRTSFSRPSHHRKITNLGQNRDTAGLLELQAQFHLLSFAISSSGRVSKLKVSALPPKNKGSTRDTTGMGAPLIPVGAVPSRVERTITETERENDRGESKAGTVLEREGEASLLEISRLNVGMEQSRNGSAAVAAAAASRGSDITRGDEASILGLAPPSIGALSPTLSDRDSDREARNSSPSSEAVAASHRRTGSAVTIKRDIAKPNEKLSLKQFLADDSNVLESDNPHIDELAKMAAAAAEESAIPPLVMKLTAIPCSNDELVSSFPNFHKSLVCVSFLIPSGPASVILEYHRQASDLERLDLLMENFNM